MSLFDLGRLALFCMLAAAGCAPAQRYAAYEPLYTRYELAVTENPDSVQRWYECFRNQDDFVRQSCLEEVPGVRASTAPGNYCVSPTDSRLFCRSFPLDVPETDGGAPEGDGDGVGSAVAEGIGDFFVAVLQGALSSDDDDDDDDDDEAVSSEAKPSRSRRNDRESYSSKNTTKRRDRESKNSYKKKGD